jgi:hypothetical protein
MPVRVYGRYQGSGAAQLTLSGTIEGKPMTRNVPLAFPIVDAANPEIERMWALSRVNRLLGESDATGSRTSVIDEIVGLGEGYSIVTQYTSFIVLENDFEYQRWQIQRKNAIRIQRDRDAQQILSTELETLRNKAADDIGPATADKPAPTPAAAPTPPVLIRPDPSTPTDQTPPPNQLRQQNSTDLDIGGHPGTGGGAIDPISGSIILIFGGIVLMQFGRTRTQKVA